MSARGSLMLALGGLFAAAIGAIGVSASEGPHLGLSDLDPWLVLYLLGLIVCLGAGPYGLFDRFGATKPDRDARWDLALSVWGGFALLAGLIFVGFGLIAGFDPASASGALAITGAGACALVVGALMLFVLSTG